MLSLIPLSISLGMRKGELFNLEKRNVHFDEVGTGYIHLSDTKNGEDRIIPLDNELTNILKQAMLRSPNRYVFPNPRTGRPYQNVRRSLRTAMKKAGVSEDYRLHWFRHTFCSRGNEDGIDRDALKEIGGWKSDSMVSRYNHPSIEYKRRAIEKMQNKVPAISTAPPKIDLDKRVEIA